MQPKYFIALTFELREEKDCWTGLCKELGTATFGDTFEEAKEDLVDAVELHLNTLEAVGERERFFKENNIELFKVIPRTKKVSMPIKKNTYLSQYIHSITEPTTQLIHACS